MSYPKKPSRPDDPAVAHRQRGAFAGDAARSTTRRSLIGSTAQPRGPPVDPDAYSLAEFCERHRISLQMFYKLTHQGLAPQTFRVGTRVLVSKEAAARWRADREAASGSARSKGSGASEEQQSEAIGPPRKGERP
jgi:hypothetical protein